MLETQVNKITVYTAKEKALTTIIKEEMKPVKKNLYDEKGV